MSSHVVVVCRDAAKVDKSVPELTPFLIPPDGRYDIDLTYFLPNPGPQHTVASM